MIKNAGPLKQNEAATGKLRKGWDLHRTDREFDNVPTESRTSQNNTVPLSDMDLMEDVRCSLPFGFHRNRLTISTELSRV